MPHNLFSTVLFDWDGTLVDTEQLHARAWKQLLAPEYHPSDETIWYGIPDTSMFEKLRPGLSHDLQTADQAISAKQQAYAQLIAPDGPPAVSGAEMVLFGLQHLKLGIVTASPRHEIELGLKKYQWDKFIQVIIAAEDIQNPKPDPEPYLLALEKIGSSAQETLVVEDTLSGVTSARAAKIQVLHYRPAGTQPVPGARVITRLPEVFEIVFGKE